MAQVVTVPSPKGQQPYEAAFEPVSLDLVRASTEQVKH